MAKTFAKTGIKRDNDRMYFIKSGAVWSVKRKKPGVRAKGSKREEVKFLKKGEKLDYSSHIYFLDKKGDVAMAKRPKRKKSKK
jgi:hypothetical protein